MSQSNNWFCFKNVFIITCFCATLLTTNILSAASPMIDYNTPLSDLQETLVDITKELHLIRNQLIFLNDKTAIIQKHLDSLDQQIQQSRHTFKNAQFIKELQNKKICYGRECRFKYVLR